MPDKLIDCSILLTKDRPILGVNKKDEVVDHLSRVISKPSSALCDISLKFFNMYNNLASLDML